MSNSVDDVDVELDKLAYLRRALKVLCKLGLKSAYLAVELTEEMMIKRMARVPLWKRARWVSV